MSKAGGTIIYNRGNLLAFVTYIADGNGYVDSGNDSKEPALGIGHKASGINKAWVIGLSSAYKYCNADGHPTRWAYQKTEDIGNHIGMGGDLYARRQIFTLIGDCLPNLLEAFEFDMIKEDRHPIIPTRGEVAVYEGGRFFGAQEMKAF